MSSEPDPESWAAFRPAPFARMDPTREQAREKKRKKSEKKGTAKRNELHSDASAPDPKRARPAANLAQPGVRHPSAAPVQSKPTGAGPHQPTATTLLGKVDALAAAPPAPTAPSPAAAPTPVLADVFDVIAQATAQEPGAPLDAPATIQVALKGPSSLKSSAPGALTEPSSPQQSARAGALGSLLASSLTEEELAAGRAPASELLAKFAGHQHGTPTALLYVKNLARKTSIEDLMRVFGSFLGAVADPTAAIEHFSQGRMRNQAFVHCASAEAAQLALRATHGFVLHSKPLILSFAKPR